MEIKVKINYHIEVGEDTIQCDSLEQAEKKLKSLRASETECYLYRTEHHGKSIRITYLMS
jgi:hypothetical protein